jgi:D-alanyl-D-alanine carboxypeptidase/D-alanyl-D-alanine-endopeptidase (penicillin-binding protein 4)
MRSAGLSTAGLLVSVFLLCLPPEASYAKTSVLLADPSGAVVYQINDTVPMIPASTLKILTSLTALETLGKEFVFFTRISYDTATHRLFLKGFGDPLLISEEVARMARQIASKFQPEQVSDIVLDNSFFSADITIPGTGRSKNPYDATTGALCANFNTFRFSWSPAQNRYISAEPQTPFLEIFKKEIRTSGQKQGRILLSPPLRERYPGLLLAEFLKQQGIPVTGKVITGPFCDGCSPVMAFASSFPLDQVVEKLLAFSNNFMANQIMLTLGAKRFGPPATLEKGVSVLNEFAETQLRLDGIKLVEGSGLSRQNRISARQMLRVLKAFLPYRRLLRQQGNEFYKTGTLSDVRTRAGYFMGKDGELYPYVIMLNGTNSGYQQILRELRQMVSEISSTRDRPAVDRSICLFQYRRRHCGCEWIRNFPR